MTPQEECDIAKSRESDFMWQVFFTTGCWLWGGEYTDHGYGFYDIGGKKVGAHRVSYMIANGAIPKGALVCHRCDNPSCVNPEHLFLGTHLDNCRDKIRKGRANPAKGMRSAHAKLTNAKVREIRKKRSEGAKIVRLAEEYGVGYGCIERVVHRQSWKHID